MLGWRGPDGTLYKTEGAYNSSVKTNKGKSSHTGMKNDRGIFIGDGTRVDLGNGQSGIRVPGGRTKVTASGSLGGNASITIGGTQLYPMLQGEDALYVPKGYKPGAPPQAAEKPEGVPGQLPPSAAIPGTGPKGNEVGSDADPDTPGLQGSGGKGGSDSRVSPKGVVQRVFTLGGINELFASLSSADRKGGAVMTAGELPSGSKFLSEALPTTKGGEEQAAKPFTLSQTDIDEGYDSSDGAYPGKATAFNQTPTTPETTSNPSDAQDGASEKPTIADNIRTVRMERNSGTNWGARTAADNSDERLKARAAFLDPNNKGYGAIRARDRAVGAFDQFGVGGVNIDGKVYNFKDGMSRDARFELSGGLGSKEQAQEFLNKYVQTVQETPEPAEVPTNTSAVTPEPEAPASEQTNTTLQTPAPGNLERNNTALGGVPLGQAPGSATEEANTAWAQQEFRLDPDKNMMVPVK